MEKITVKLTFIEDILGTCPNDKEIYKNFIVDKAKANGAEISQETENAELAALPTDEEIEKGMTVFPMTDDGTPFLYDYQIKGFFKDTCGMLKKVSGTESSKIKAYKKEIDGLIFPQPRQIVFENWEMDICQRPLRAQTMQGERVALAMSEQIKAGATVTFDIVCLTDSHMNAVKEWLNYGEYRGIGQWRNSGKGRMLWDLLDENGNVVGGNNAYIKTRK